MRHLSPKERAALTALLDYTEPSERADAERHAQENDGDTTGHVIEHVDTLRAFLSEPWGFAGHMTNVDRAMFGEYAARAGEPDQGIENGEPETALSDVLANLRHWAEREGIDYERADHAATIHYQAETTGDESC